MEFWSSLRQNRRQHVTNLLQIRAMLLHVFESLSKTCNALQHCKYRKTSSTTGCYTRMIFRASYHCKSALQIDQRSNTTFRFRCTDLFLASICCAGNFRLSPLLGYSRPFEILVYFVSDTRNPTRGGSPGLSEDAERTHFDISHHHVAPAHLNPPPPLLRPHPPHPLHPPPPPPPTHTHTHLNFQPCTCHQSFPAFSSLRS